MKKIIGIMLCFLTLLCLTGCITIVQSPEPEKTVSQSTQKSSDQEIIDNFMQMVEEENKPLPDTTGFLEEYDGHENQLITNYSIGRGRYLISSTCESMGAEGSLSYGGNCYFYILDNQDNPIVVFTAGQVYSSEEFKPQSIFGDKKTFTIDNDIVGGTLEIDCIGLNYNIKIEGY